MTTFCFALPSLRRANRQAQVKRGDPRQGLGWLRWPETKQTQADDPSQAWHWWPHTRDTDLRLETVTLRVSLTRPMTVAQKFTPNSYQNFPVRFVTLFYRENCWFFLECYRFRGPQCLQCLDTGDASVGSKRKRSPQHGHVRSTAGPTN